MRKNDHNLALLLSLALGIGVVWNVTAHPRESADGKLPACEWCGADEAPAQLSSSLRIARADEPGERLTVTGTIYKADSQTAAPDILVYVYHTNAAGIYPKRGDETGNARRHGYLRGWLRTDKNGKYRIETIRPASYPSRTEPAHIHMTVTPPGGTERWIDSILFADDHLLTKQERSRLEGRGGSGIVDPARDPSGAWRATRDIVMDH